MRREDFDPGPPHDEVEFMRSATVVLDTNVLLGLYRLSAKARDDALCAIESVAERLWLPHQVAVEFYRNHTRCRDERRSAYLGSLKVLDTFVQAVTKPLGTGETHRDVREAVACAVAGGVERLRETIQSLLDADTAIPTVESDDVLVRIEAAFAGRVGAEPEPSTIRTRVEEFVAWRQPNRIPPGYRDDGKPDPIRRAADYLIWAEVLGYAKGRCADVLLVTNDAKGDWWDIVDGTPRPHHRLVREYARTRSGRYHQVSLKTFVGLAAQAFDREADEDALDEIEAVADESRAEEERTRIGGQVALTGGTRPGQSGRTWGTLAALGSRHSPAFSLLDSETLESLRGLGRWTPPESALSLVERAALDADTLESLRGLGRWTPPESALSLVERAALDASARGALAGLADIDASSSTALRGIVASLNDADRVGTTMSDVSRVGGTGAPTADDGQAPGVQDE